MLATTRELQLVRTSGEGTRFQLTGTQFAEQHGSWGELCLAPGETWQMLSGTPLCRAQELAGSSPKQGLGECS